MPALSVRRRRSGGAFSGAARLADAVAARLATVDAVLAAPLARDRMTDLPLARGAVLVAVAAWMLVLLPAMLGLG